jgi:hypothetical protein
MVSSPSDAWLAAHTKHRHCERRESGVAAWRRSDERRSFLSERGRQRRILDVRAADLQEEMAEQRSSVPPNTTKTAAISEHRSERSEQSKHSAMREQCIRKGVLS